MKVKITVKTTETTILDIGSIPFAVIKDLLVKRGDGTFDGNYSPGDAGKTEYTYDSIEVESAEKGK